MSALAVSGSRAGSARLALGTRETPRAELGGAARASKSRLVHGGRAGPWRHAGRSVGPAGRGRGGAGRGGEQPSGPGSAGQPETRREPHASGRLAAAGTESAAAATTWTRLRLEQRRRQRQQQPLQLEQQQQSPQGAALRGRALPTEAARPHRRPLWRVHAPGAPGSTMARARQEGSSPEPVEGLARDGPRPFPLSRLVPSAVSCGLCEPGLPPAPATPALLPAAYLCAPAALPAVTAALGAPRWPGGPRSRPRGPHPNGPQPSLSPAEQHLESPVPSAPGALAGGPTQAAPGIRGEEEQWAREIGAQLRRMADDLDALYERRVKARGAAATPPLAVEGPVQSHPGTAALAQGPRSPRDGAQLGACTCLVDVGDLGGRTLPHPDALASTGDVFCTM
ncbi:hypothetical protein QTO34_010211 [Cnephaeus nilssonii]|uniref:Bcl-2-binding component 3 n=1 Tax=Cnephaeus nilssonii TaxID=3371016 RepID=A0AA40HF20_CNENI|nr:hypothetical protein QTO34_010211 [Eptesicus nilssonii]